MSVYHEINAENLVWSAGTVTLNGKAVGLVCPSALEGVDNLTDQKLFQAHRVWHTYLLKTNRR